MIAATSNASDAPSGRSLGERLFVGGLIGSVLGGVGFFGGFLVTFSFEIGAGAGVALFLVGLAVGARPRGGGDAGANLLVGERGFQIVSGAAPAFVDGYDAERPVSLLLTRNTNGIHRVALFVHDATGAFAAPVLDGLPDLRSVAWTILERRAAARLPIERERLARGGTVRFHYEEPGGKRSLLELDSRALRVPATRTMAAVTIPCEGAVGSVRDGNIVLESGAARATLRFSSLADAPVLFALVTGQSLFVRVAADAAIAQTEH